MPKITYRIESIWDGLAASQYFAKENSYLSGIGIDPDLPLSDSTGDNQTSGMLRPSAYAEFSGVALNNNPTWIMTNPKDALIYTLLRNGRLLSYTSSFGSETNIGTISPADSGGAAYYNNFLYLLNTTNVSRYGPLDGSPSLTNSVWTGATLGSQTALVDTVYPNIRGTSPYPNHSAHVHTDNKLYFCDFKDGEGRIHYIKTKKVTDEGDTNDGSTYDALVNKLPFGFMPMDIESWGNDIVIAAIQTSNDTLNQGRSALFFWDTAASTFYNIVWLPDPLVTALLNNNGALYIWSGAVSSGANVSNGYRISVYTGGRTTKQIYFSEIGCSPPAGAVEAFGNRIVWGTFYDLQTATAGNPDEFAVLMALGSKRHDVPQGAHCIVNLPVDTGTQLFVSSVKNVQNSSFAYPKFVAGAVNDASGDVDLFSQSTTYGTSIFRSRMFNIGNKFRILEIRIPLGAAVATNHTITPTIFLDDFSTSSTTGLTVINNTNYANSERVVKYKPNISGNNNFVLELKWTGTALLPVLFPIEIIVEVRGD